MVVSNFIARCVVKLASKFTPETIGVTIWPFIFVWPKRFKDNKALLRHERVHLKQWVRYWIIGFPFVYIYQYMVYGYLLMPLEVEAREHAIQHRKT